jgi:nitric oxide dioxygenase
MLGRLAATGAARPVTVVHADRTPADHPHRDEQLRLAAGLPADLHLFYEQDAPEGARTGFADLTAIGLADPARVTAYLCGPLPFMRAARGALLELGVPAAAIHYEVFGPDLWLGGE